MSSLAGLEKQDIRRRFPSEVVGPGSYTEATGGLCPSLLLGTFQHGRKAFCQVDNLRLQFHIVVRGQRNILEVLSSFVPVTRRSTGALFGEGVKGKEPGGSSTGPAPLARR